MADSKWMSKVIDKVSKEFEPDVVGLGEEIAQEIKSRMPAHEPKETERIIAVCVAEVLKALFQLGMIDEIEK